jgi:hypothetical protein
MASTLPILQLPPAVRAALALALWIAVLVCGIIFLAYAVVLVVVAIRRARRGHDLDRAVLQLQLRRRRKRPASRIRSLERRIVWGVLAGGILDPSRRFIWLPDTLEVLLAPGDLRALGNAARHVRRQVQERLLAVAQASPVRFRTPPIVVFAEDVACQPGRPTLRLSFTEVTEQVDQTHGSHRNSTRTGNVRVLRHAYLRPMRPPGPPRLLQIGRQYAIGRLPSCDLMLEQPAVSRRHAVLYERNGAWYIADAGSTNGTFVNLMPAVEPIRLSNTDEIRLGRAVSIRFELRSHRHQLQ